MTFCSWAATLRITTNAWEYISSLVFKPITIHTFYCLILSCLNHAALNLIEQYGNSLGYNIIKISPVSFWRVEKHLHLFFLCVFWIAIINVYAETQSELGVWWKVLIDWSLSWKGHLATFPHAGLCLKALSEKGLGSQNPLSQLYNFFPRSYRYLTWYYKFMDLPFASRSGIKLHYFILCYFFSSLRNYQNLE